MYKSGSTVWHHHTLQHAVSRRHTALAVPTSGPPTCSSCRFHERGHATATGVSCSTVPLCRTVCRLRSTFTGHVTKINWKVSSSELSSECAFAALANFRDIHHLIIIIIIKKVGVIVENFPLGGAKRFDRRHVLTFSWVVKSPQPVGSYAISLNTWGFNIGFYATISRMVCNFRISFSLSYNARWGLWIDFK